MREQGYGGGMSGVQVTPLARTILIALVSLYVMQLLLVKSAALSGLVEALYLWPLSSGNWRIWQPFTCLLVNGPTPLAAFFDWLFLFFILGPVETLMGTRRFLRAMAAVLVFSAGATFLLDAAGMLSMSAVEPVYMGLNPVMVGLLVFFGLAMPNAQILLFFVLPIRASWVAWVSGLLSLLFFLFTPTLGTSMSLFGWVGAYLWSSSSTGMWKRFLLRRKQVQLERELERFQVIDGGKKDDDWVH